MKLYQHSDLSFIFYRYYDLGQATPMRLFSAVKQKPQKATKKSTEDIITSCFNFLITIYPNLNNLSFNTAPTVNSGSPLPIKSFHMQRDVRGRPFSIARKTAVIFSYVGIHKHKLPKPLFLLSPPWFVWGFPPAPLPSRAFQLPS